jgi:hypothetical protein
MVFAITTAAAVRVVIARRRSVADRSDSVMAFAALMRRHSTGRRSISMDRRLLHWFAENQAVVVEQ